MRLLIREGAWAVSPELKQRLDGAIAFALEGREILVTLPSICHGSLKTEHLLFTTAGSVVACDTDHSRYVQAPFDEVHDVWRRLKNSPRVQVESALRRLASVTAEANAFHIAASWLLVYIVFDTLLRLTSGKEIVNMPASRFCYEYPYAYRTALTQLR